MKTLGIIGFGQLGQFMAKHLKKFLPVSAFDVQDKRKEAEAIGVRLSSLEETASRDLVIISVPINKFEDTLEKINHLVKPGALVLDVCSVKILPSKMMKEKLRKDVEIIATHPLFGPQSGANGIKGLKIVLCPIRTKRLKSVKEFLEKALELKVIVTTPEEHDRSMATAACLSHFIGRSLINLGIEEQEISEPSFSNLINLKNMLKEDSLELFRDIQAMNPFAHETREKFIAEIIKLNKELKGGKAK